MEHPNPSLPQGSRNSRFSQVKAW